MQMCYHSAGRYVDRPFLEQNITVNTRGYIQEKSHMSARRARKLSADQAIYMLT